MTHIDLIINCIYAFILFCMIASSIYILNDIRDLPFDQMHPEKSKRPLAAGHVSLRGSMTTAFLLAGTSIVLSYLLTPQLTIVLAAYLMLNVAYSVILKHIVLLDIVCIALGFLLRLQAGAVVTDIALSGWILALTLLLSLFIALGKRRDDVVAYHSYGSLYRIAAIKYTLPLVDNGLKTLAILILLLYGAYTISPQITEQMGSSYLFTTLLWVALGIGRYLHLVFEKGKGGSPTRLLLKDHLLQLILFAWIANFIILIY